MFKLTIDGPGFNLSADIGNGLVSDIVSKVVERKIQPPFRVGPPATPVVAPVPEYDQDTAGDKRPDKPEEVSDTDGDPP